MDDITFAGNLLAARHERLFGSFQVQGDPMGVDRLHGTDDDLVLLPAEAVKSVFALRPRRRWVMTCLAVWDGDADWKS